VIFWVIHISILVLVLFWITRITSDQINPLIVLVAALTKITAGIVLGLIYYKFYGTGDTIRYFELALKLSHHFTVNEILFESIESLQAQPRVEAFVKIVSLFYEMTGGSYWLISTYFSLISFIASTYFIITICNIYPTFKNPTIVAFYFIPSICFWNSGLTKDALAFFLVTVLITICIKAINNLRISWLEFIMLPIGLIGLYKIKHYLLITFILFAGITFIWYVFKNSKRIVAIGIAILIAITVFITSQNIHPFLNLDRLPLTLYENNQAIYSKTDIDKRLPIELTSPTWNQVLKNTPNALAIGLLKPNLLDKTISFGWFHRIENFILLILIVLSILEIIRRKNLEFNMGLLLPAVVSIIFLATVLALSTPNYGSLVRYKSVFLPYLFLIASIIPYNTFARNNYIKS